MKKTNMNLVPSCVNPSPDYYCTWQTQLYATSDGKPEGQRAIIGEKGLFDTEKPYGWAYFYEKARGDLFIVMDDSWDVPPSGDEGYFGSLILDAEKFPESTRGAQSNEEALSRLVKRMEALGWKGLGGWVCAQEAPIEGECASQKERWREKILEAERAGFSYWKVDWGKWGHDAAFRRMICDLKTELSVRLTVEQAMMNEVIPYADAFRTYDVPAIMSIPMTMTKLADILREAPEAGIINCEDEVYIAAAGGFSMGVMRHPYEGCFPNGEKDMSFPSVHRSLKTKMTEVTRAVRWHRIAPAFSVGAGKTLISEQMLVDSWCFESLKDELEAWWLDVPTIRDFLKDGVLSKSAPAQLTRGTAPAEVLCDGEGRAPFIVTAKNPSGALSVATLGRTHGRTYGIPRCDVSLCIGDAHTVGVFGEYKSLRLLGVKEGVKSVLMQDLADDVAYDVTDLVSLADGVLTVGGDLISKIGTLSNPVGDTSEPGALIKLVY